MATGEQKALQEWEVVKNLKKDEKKAEYLEAYLTVIEYYTRKYADQFNLEVKSEVSEKGLEYKTQYNHLGAFFTPNSSHRGDICHTGEEKDCLSTPGLGDPTLPGKL